MHKKINHMLETLLCVIEMQLCDLENVDTKELGEAIDMVKDLEEAMYYCTVIEAMHGKDYEVEWEMKKGGPHQEEKQDESRMYYNGGGRYNDSRTSMPRNSSSTMMNGSGQNMGGTSYMDNGNGQNTGSTSYADNGNSRNTGGASYADNGNGRSGGNQSYMDNGNGPHYDDREGRSYINRRMYMEAREMNKDKTSQLRELEKYMQELSSDVVDMISDASPEEKQYLEKKISALAQKVGQMK